MTFDEWKQAGSPPPMSFDQWKASQQGAKPAPQAPQEPGLGENLMSFAKGLGHGAMAPVRGVSQLYSRAFGTEQELQKKLDEEKAAEDALTGWGQAGNIAGQVGTAFIPVAGWAGKAAQGANVAAKGLSAAAKGANALGRTGKAAASGAAVGALNPVVGGDTDTYDESKFWQAGLGAGLSGGLSKLGQRVFDPAKLEGMKQASRDFGGMATPGQLMAGRGSKTGEYLGELEEQAGRWLAGTGIEAARQKGRSEATKNLVRDVSQQAGLGRHAGSTFDEVLEGSQAAKKAAYDKAASGMSIGDTATFQQGMHDFFKSSPAIQKLNNQELQTVQQIMKGLFPASSQTGSSLVSASGQKLTSGTKPGGYSGLDVQRALSDLSGDIKNSFASSSGSDKRVGEALKAMRGYIEDNVKKHSAPGTWDELQKLNKAHTQLGKIQGAANYKKAIEGGEPRLGDIVQRAAAGAGDRPLNAARQQLVDRAVQLEKIGGKGYAPSDLRDIQRLVSFGSHIPSMLGGKAIYNDKMIKLYNKMAQAGDPAAIKALERLGLIGGALQ